MAVNQVPSLEEEDKKYPVFHYLHQPEPKDYNWVITKPQPILPYDDAVDFLFKEGLF
jgi:hypothetical protein